MILYVETHWILSVVQAEEWEAPSLLGPPGPGAPKVYLPAFCVAEAIARFRTIEREAGEFLARLGGRRRALHRNQHREARGLIAAIERAMREQQELTVVLSSEFNAFMEHIFASHIELIPETHAAIKRAHGYVGALNMSRGDAVVLATVIEHAALQGADRKAFLSGNTVDFGPRSLAYKELEGAWIKSCASIKGALGWLTGGAPPGPPDP